MDSSKSFVQWGKRNAVLSSMLPSSDTSTSFSGVRWMVDDCMSFMQRELRRGRGYHGVILDPPAFGRAPKGKGKHGDWRFDRDIDELLKLAVELLLYPKNACGSEGTVLENIGDVNNEPLFLLVTCHSLQLSPQQLAEKILYQFQHYVTFSSMKKVHEKQNLEKIISCIKDLRIIGNDNYYDTSYPNNVLEYGDMFLQSDPCMDVDEGSGSASLIMGMFVRLRIV